MLFRSHGLLLSGLRGLGPARLWGPTCAGPKKKASGSPAARENRIESPAPRRFSRAPRRRGEEEMKLKQLEGLLGGLTQFSDPKVQLSITSRL